MLFTDLLQSSYADQIEAYKGEKIVYSREKQDKDSAEVDTKVVKKNGEELSVNYISSIRPTATGRFMT